MAWSSPPRMWRRPSDSTGWSCPWTRESPGDWARRPNCFRADGTDSLEAAFIELLPREKRRGHKPVQSIGCRLSAEVEIAITRGLTKRFGNFVAVDHVTMRVRRGGFSASWDQRLRQDDHDEDAHRASAPSEARRNCSAGRSMPAIWHAGACRLCRSRSRSTELTVRQNLVLHARIFSLPAGEIPAEVADG